jgi:hypothetical protein
VDQDCDGLVDEDFDRDEDGWTTCRGDCDDDRSDANPAAVETCNGEDDDCDDEVDEGFDRDGDGETPCAGDCDDDDPEVNTAAAENCDGVDDDCDGLVDEDFDFDGDGTSPCAGDCDDDDPARSPTEPEVCNGVDDDCDGAVDEGHDLDGDGFTSCGGDEDDNDPRVFPGSFGVFVPGPEETGCNQSGGGATPGVCALLALLLIGLRRRHGAPPPLAGACALLLLAPGLASATTWQVGGTGSQFATIADAIAASSSGDTIYVDNLYNQPFETLNPGAKSLTLVSQAPPSSRVGGDTGWVVVDGGGSLIIERLRIIHGIDVTAGSLTLIEAQRGTLGLVPIYAPPIVHVGGDRKSVV